MLNPEIAEEPDRADEVIYKLRAMLQPFPADNLIAQNGAFKKKIFEENSFPFGENGRSVSVQYFGTMTRDRLDLETQITATFNASDIPNLQSLATKQELIDFFEQDMRKIAITTIFRFGDVDSVPNQRDNIILMVDEAHRTQEGNPGEKMRLALPNAFFLRPDRNAD